MATANNSRKAILHVLVRLDYGGIETWLINILRNYNQDKFQMDVCLIGRRGKAGILAEQARDTGSAVFVLPLRNPIRFLRQFKQLAANYDAVVVHTGIHISPLVLFAAYLGGVQHRLSMLHTTRNMIPIRGLDNRIDGPLLRLCTSLCNHLNKILATGVLGCSAAVLDQNYPGWRTGHFAQVLYLGVDLDRFTLEGNCKKLRESLGIPNGALIIGHVGRFNREKNHHDFICVAEYLSKTYPNAHFLLVGDGPLRVEIELQIKDAGLKEHFHLTGLRNDVPQLMQIMDLALFPSLYEGLPMTFIEAQVTGLPLVTAARSEMREALCPENHKWYIVESMRVEDYADAIVYLLSQSELRNQLVARAQRWASQRFSITQSALALENILIQYLEGIRFV